MANVCFITILLSEITLMRLIGNYDFHAPNDGIHFGCTKARNYLFLYVDWRWETLGIVIGSLSYPLDILLSGYDYIA